MRIAERWRPQSCCSTLVAVLPYRLDSSTTALVRGFTAVLVTHDVQEAVVLADRILLVEQGRLAMDLAVGLARPRARGSAAFGVLEKQVLDRVLDVRHSDVHT